MTSARRPSRTETRIDFEINQTAHGFSVGTPVYHNGTQYAASSASAAATAEVVGIVSEVADVNNFTLLTSGKVKNLSTLTAGSVYFLSETAGQVTTTEPTISKPVYYAVSSTEAIFLPYRGSTGVGSGGTGGDMVLISTATPSAVSSVDFTDLDSTYFAYKVIYEFQKNTSASDLYIRTSSNNGSSFDAGASDYKYRVDGDATGTPYGSTGATIIPLLHENGNSADFGANKPHSGEVTIYNPSKSEYTNIRCDCMVTDTGGNILGSMTAGTRKSTTPVDAIRFLPGSGTITGTFKLYGIK